MQLFLNLQKNMTHLILQLETVMLSGHMLLHLHSIINVIDIILHR